MKNLALQLPGFGQIDNPPKLFEQFSSDPNRFTLGFIISQLLNIVFYVAAFLAFYYLVWGAFHYILASGNKEELGKARNRITWALVGLLVIFSAYFIARYASEILPPTKGGIPF